MNKGDKKKWIDALRSGKYKQRTGFLGNETQGYCCLGVACKALGVGFQADSCYLPNELQERLGLDSAGTLKKAVKVKDCLYSTLLGLNDKAKLNFEQIADVIERQF